MQKCVRAAVQRCKPPGSYLHVPALRRLSVFVLFFAAAAIGDVQRRLGLAASCITEVRRLWERSRDLAAIAGDAENCAMFEDGYLKYVLDVL